MSERKMEKSDCAGCYNNFYNGNNNHGVTECWSFASATLEPRLLIHVDQAPPYNKDDAELHPTCYKRQRFVTVKPEALDDEGYWKR